MSKAEKRNNKQAGKEEGRPTASFNGSVPGGQIGPFRIERELGRGAVGVVYLAHDTKLDRPVAIKSLPAEVMANPKARSRFSREARLLASLNHPNIATIYDEFQETEDVAYLILEYVPGQTLAERIAGARLKLEEALSIALQIAEAVAAAHEHDVIHRDLKPGNIKITPEGKVKVLDFGLAKVVGGEALDQQSTVTEPGRVIGTPAYMSPEQARGKATDKRSDIWSFGCVLYEMLTATVPFKGETVSDTLANILQTDPNWHALPESTPANIQVLLRRCLEKDPRRRLQHIGDARIEISETLSLPATTSVISAPLTGKRRSTLWWLGIGCSFVGLIVGLIAAGLFLSRPTAPSLSELIPASTRRTIIRLPENQVLGIFQSTPLSDRRLALALSPDGSRLVYVAYVAGTTQLFERRMDQFGIRLIAGTEGAFAPFFAPDGQSVGFFTTNALKVVSLLAGEPATLCDVRIPYSGSWGDDGMIYFTEGGRLSRVPADGGDRERLEDESVRPAEGYLQVLPGSQMMLVSGRGGTCLFSPRTGQTRMLAKAGAQARYVPTGHLVYIGVGAIEAVPFDLATREVTGPSVPVLEGVLWDDIGGPAQFALSNDGLLVYAPGGGTAKSIPTWVDRQGNVEPLSMPAQSYGTFRLSPDGKRLAIVVEELRSNVYIYDVARGRGTRLTLEGDNYYPLWTPDGKRITFCCRREGEENWSLFWALADGSGEAELLCSGKSKLAPCSWSSDGKLLALYSGDLDLWVLPLEGPRELELILGTKFKEVFPGFSPDDRWIAYKSDRDGRDQIYVRPYPAMDRVWQISYDLGHEPIWSLNGDELFYRSGNKWMVVSISTEPEFAAGTPQVLFEGPYRDVSGLSYDVASDGQRFLVLQPEYDDSEVRELHVVTNWFEELKRLVPTGKN